MKHLCSLAAINLLFPNIYVESFLVVALLSEVLDPLKRFVECCHQLKFAIVSVDPSFEALSAIVNGLFNDFAARCLSSADCLDYARRICAVLEGLDDNEAGIQADIQNQLPIMGYLSSMTASDNDMVKTRESILNRLPAFKLFGHLSSHSEVWCFAREMGWFGRKGLKRFYEEYANVTNALPGKIESYETSVLDAMEPTIRAVSAVGGLCEEPVLVKLLNKMQEDKDIRIFLESDSGRRDISQVQTNLSLIRDWFTIGVDEIAAINGRFGAVWSTGEYCLRSGEASSDILLPAGIEDAMLPVLTLQYQAQRDAPVKSFLQREELAAFIEEIGLIQHENESASESVNDFVEQYHVLSRAADNSIFMTSLGFEEDDSESFRCLVGGQHLDRARDLLFASESALTKCQSWLDLTRSSHFVSLLFWTQELREIHRAIRRSMRTEEPAIIRNLTRTLSRLSPRQMSHENRYSITQATVSSWKDSSSSWLVDVSLFLDSLHESFGAPWKRKVTDIKSPSQIVLHTIACASDAVLGLSLRVLKHIYKVSRVTATTLLFTSIPLFVKYFVLCFAH